MTVAKLYKTNLSRFQTKKGFKRNLISSLRFYVKMVTRKISLLFDNNIIQIIFFKHGLRKNNNLNNQLDVWIKVSA